MKIGVAMSGGVDSSVTAALLKKQGWDVHGYYMKLPLPDLDVHIQRLEKLTTGLGIPLHFVDLRDSFTKNVISYFVDEYKHGHTPNPCIFCNKTIKFGRLLSTMLDQGMEKMATGHYARIQRNNNVRLRRGVDVSKDQSYFLCRLTQRQLDFILFPLGELRKKDVYVLATEMGITGFNREESQDVCFLAGRTVSSALKQYGVKESPGEIISTDGQVLGRHTGLFNYTIGQRRGLGLPDDSPWYVRALDSKRNRVIVCKSDELFSSKLVLDDVQWNGEKKDLPFRCLVQLRSRHRPEPAQIIENNREKSWTVIFDKPQRAITPGQFAALYQGDQVQGSGVISDLVPYAGGEAN